MIRLGRDTRAALASLLGSVLGEHLTDIAAPVGAARLVAQGRIRPIPLLPLLRFVREVARRRGLGGPQVLIRLHALVSPDRPALVDGDVRLSFGELDRRIIRLAHGLHARGIGHGTPVATFLTNCHQYVELPSALGYLGAAIVQIGYRLKAKEVAHVLADSGARLVVFSSELQPILEQAVAIAGLPERDRIFMVGKPLAPLSGPAAFASYERLLDAGDPDEPPQNDAHGHGQILTYTSGTTGHVKGAHRDFANTGYGPVVNFLADLPIGPDERHLVLCPLYHSMAPFFTMVTHGFGGAVVIHPGHFDPEQVLRTIERERITSTLVVPTMLSRLLSVGRATLRKYDLSSLRAIISGAAPLPTELARQTEEALGPILYNFYGATETGVVTLALPGEHTARPGTIGRLVFGNQARILNGEGGDVAEGEVGELYIKNAMMMSGYHKNPEATASATRDGYFSVGDLARRDRDGYYYLADRKHDLVISGGVNIYPWEIEQRLYAHPKIGDAAVVGVPDPEWGETLAAFLVVKPNEVLTIEEVQAWVTGELADYKKPRRVIFVEALPRSPTGKVLKRELRQRLA